MSKFMTVEAIELDADNQRIAVLIADDGKQAMVPLEDLPEGTVEGDVVSMSLLPDVRETQRRKKAVGDLQDKLFGDKSKVANIPRQSKKA